jgi:alpha-tubulin suppressor-like RCC1 family protein/tRNA A-37 threonylcarbamoyl transferase component Bud32
VKANVGPGSLPRFAALDDEYEILRELGRGGTAVVYLARQRDLERYVAIKVVRATYVEDEDAVARLLREADTVARLDHPNIVKLYGTRRLGDDSLALILQYVSGRTLKQELHAHGALPFEQVRRVLRDIGGALACAHGQRIVHRDVKPENIYLDAETGSARIADFGIARSWGPDSSLTLPGTAIGTPAYMSPEQVDGRDLDGRSDVYSLGLVAWEMLTGRAPWAGENLYSIIYKQKTEPLPPLVELRPDVPADLLRAVEGALHKEPAGRWADADTFLDVLHGEGRGGTRGGKRRQKRRQKRRRQGREGHGTATYTRRGGATAVPASGTAATSTGALAAQPGALAAQPGDLVTNATVRYRRPQGEPSEARSAAPTPAPSLAAAGGHGPDMGILPSEHAKLAAVVPRRPRRMVAIALVSLFAASPLLLAIGYATSRAMGSGTYPAVPGLAASGSPDGGGDTAGATAGERSAARAPALAYALVGDGQEGVAGDTANGLLVLRVEDAAGRPLSGINVRFQVASGAGRLAPEEAVTDDSGLAFARWVPSEPGLHTVEAYVEGLNGAPTTFRALARMAASDSLAVEVMADGDDAAPEPSGPAPLVVRRGMAAGGMHTCWLGSDGAATCWGGNDSGQLGDGTSSRRAAPVRVAAPEPLAQLAAGVTHSCAVGVSGSAFCWGANGSGQLGTGTRASHTQPARVATTQRIVAVGTGTSHSCGVTAAGRLLCWGDNAYGQLGDGSQAGRAGPVAVSGGRTFRSVSPGWAHTCAITTAGTAFCWGRNAFGELGDGGLGHRAVPAEVTGGHRFAAIATGAAHSCGLRTDGIIICWGQNSHGQLGNGSASNSAVPTPVATEHLFTVVAAGGNHTCGLTRDGSALCWGRNTYGQLGDGTQVDRAQPAAVVGGHRFTALEASGAHTCGMTADGGRLCWGFNLDGQLGNGTRTNTSRPTAAGRG